MALCLGVFSLPASAGNTDWTVTFGPHARYEEVVYGNGMFVAVGDGLIVSSADGKKWTVEHSVAKDWPVAVAWSGSMFVAVGMDGMILTSHDGKEWTERNVDASLYAVVWGNNQFMAVGRGGRYLLRLTV
jgi:hypothetical protein